MLCRVASPRDSCLVSLVFQIHIDLGSGDGRVCFHAIDVFGVSQSLGIEVESEWIEAATERKHKRHPPPDHLEFREGDLLQDTTWEFLFSKSPTLVTMYFVPEALEQLKPYLEKLQGMNDCRIVTCGYEVPGWQPSSVQVVLGLPIFLYRQSEAPMPEQLLQSKGVTMHEEDLAPIPDKDLDGIEIVEQPLFDEEEKIDFHWDDFDDEEEDSKEDDSSRKP